MYGRLAVKPAGAETNASKDTQSTVAGQEVVLAVAPEHLVLMGGRPVNASVEGILIKGSGTARDVIIGCSKRWSASGTAPGLCQPPVKSG